MDDIEDTYSEIEKENQAINKEQFMQTYMLELHKDLDKIYNLEDKQKILDKLEEDLENKRITLKLYKKLKEDIFKMQYHHINDVFRQSFNVIKTASFILNVNVRPVPVEIQEQLKDLKDAFEEYKTMEAGVGPALKKRLRKGLREDLGKLTEGLPYWKNGVSKGLLNDTKLFYSQYDELIKLIYSYNEIKDQENEDEKIKILNDYENLKEQIKRPKRSRDHEFPKDFIVESFLHTALAKSLNIQDYFDIIIYHLFGRHNYVTVSENSKLKNKFDNLKPNHFPTPEELYEGIVDLVKGVSEEEWNEVYVPPDNIPEKPKLTDSKEYLSEYQEKLKKKIQKIDDLISRK